MIDVIETMDYDNKKIYVKVYVDALNDRLMIATFSHKKNLSCCRRL